MAGVLGFTNIDMSGAEVAYGNSATQLVTMNDTNMRYLAGIPQSATNSTISFSQLANAAFVVASSAGASVNVYTTATTAGWNGLGPLWFQITGNTYSSATGTASVVVGGNFPKGLILQINSGVYVIGKGGGGGPGRKGASGLPGNTGGVAIAVSGYSGGQLYINNLGTIAGGGGGGGGGGYGNTYSPPSGYFAGSTTYYTGGTGGGAAAFGTGPVGSNSGTLLTGGAGTNGNGGTTVAAGKGGTGGTPGNSGSAGTGGTSPGAGGAAGAATSGTVAASAIWINTGTRTGTVG